MMPDSSVMYTECASSPECTPLRDTLEHLVNAAIRSIASLPRMIGIETCRAKAVAEVCTFKP